MHALDQREHAVAVGLEGLAAGGDGRFDGCHVRFARRAGAGFGVCPGSLGIGGGAVLRKLAALVMHNCGLLALPSNLKNSEPYAYF